METFSILIELTRIKREAKSLVPRSLFSTSLTKSLICKAEWKGQIIVQILVSHFLERGLTELLN